MLGCCRLLWDECYASGRGVCVVGERVFSGRVPRVVGALPVGILPFVDTYLLLPFYLSHCNNTSYLFNSIHANTRVRILLLPSTNNLTPRYHDQRQSRPKHYSQHLQQPPNMPIFRTLTTKIKTSLSPSSSPETSPDGSPTSPQVSSFERISGRKEGGVSGAVKRPEVQTRVDSYMTQGSNASNESVEEKKQRRLSRFREELDFEAED